MFGTVFVMQCVVSILVFNRLDWQEKAGCFTLVVFQMSLSVMWHFLTGTIGWCAMCECGISFLIIFAYFTFGHLSYNLKTHLDCMRA